MTQKDYPSARLLISLNKITNMKLPIEFKQKWIAALRSGDYKQGKGWLYNKGADGEITYCCLGVAACVLGIPLKNMECATLTGTKHPNVTEEIYDVLKDTGECIQTRQNVLMGMNDAENKTFAEIADYIKQNL